MSQHRALDDVRGERSDGGAATSWYVEDGVLHVTHQRRGEYSDEATHLHFRLVQIEQQWVEVDR